MSVPLTPMWHIQQQQMMAAIAAEEAAEEERHRLACFLLLLDGTGVAETVATPMSDPVE